MCMKRIDLNAAVLMRAEGKHLKLIRNYENLSMNYYGEHSAADFTKLLQQGKKWKRVKILRLPFEDDDVYRKLMMQLESWVESLKLYYLHGKKDDLREYKHQPEDELETDMKDNRGSFNFRKLTDLDIEGCNSSFLSVFTISKLKLKKLRLIGLDPEHVKLSGKVSKILAQCGELEELSLANLKMSTVLSDDAIKMMSFNLKKFDVSFYNLYDDQKVEAQNAVKAFLKARSNGIKCLTVDGVETSVGRFLLE